MSVVHPGEEVVLDLVVEATVQLAEPPAAHVGGGDNLQALRVFFSVCILFLKDYLEGLVALVRGKAEITCL